MFRDRRKKFFHSQSKNNKWINIWFCDIFSQQKKKSNIGLILPEKRSKGKQYSNEEGNPPYIFVFMVLQIFLLSFSSSLILIYDYYMMDRGSVDTYIINLYIQKNRKKTNRYIKRNHDTIHKHQILTKWKFRFFQNDKRMKNVWKSFTFDEMINIRKYHHYHYIDRQ